MGGLRRGFFLGHEKFTRSFIHYKNEKPINRKGKKIVEHQTHISKYTMKAAKK